MPGKIRKLDWHRIIGLFVFITLVASIIYITVSIILAPSEPLADEPFTKVKGEYTLMLVQCILGLLVFFLPMLLNRKLNMRLPSYMYTLYFVFLYCAIFLGEVRNFYYLIPYWDSLLHCFSGAMLGALGFSLVDVLNDNKKVGVSLSPFFVCFFSLCFALACGAAWEIYEFSFDGILGLNMQKHSLESGEALSGRDAVADTMKDLIVDFIGAFIITVLGYVTLKKKKKAGITALLGSSEEAEEKAAESEQEQKISKR